MIPCPLILTILSIMSENKTIFNKVTVFGKIWTPYNVAHRSDVVKKVCYAVILQSQLGPRSGELMLQEEDTVVSGYFDLLGHRNRFSGSVLQSGKYLISGALSSPVDKEPYDAIFTVRDGRLRGGLVSRHGCWDLSGVRMTPAATRSKAEC